MTCSAGKNTETPMRRFSRCKAAIVLLLIFASCGWACAQDSRHNFYTPAPLDTLHPVAAKHAMVVAQEKLAARIGAQVMAGGGNAVDAAVATAFAMAVTYPRAGNLGGGGFMVIHLAAANQNIAIDYRETAPAAATQTMFLGVDGKPDAAKSRDQALGIGVPGTVAGLALALDKYGSGKFKLSDIVQPAIALARDGFTIADDTADTLPDWYRRLAKWPSSVKIFSRPDGTSLQQGDTLIQSDLAATLEAIGAQGVGGFYDGPVADKLIAAIQGAGGIMTRDDLKNYSPVVREPVLGSYRGYDIVSMPLPSSGGIVLVESLNILEGFDLFSLGEGSVDALHLTIEAMKRGYGDRAHYLGDPDFVSAPARQLISKDYAARQRASIDINKAIPWTDILAAGTPHEGSNTTHFSVVDKDGNAVSNTFTLNFSYGLGLIADGTGVLLNNELDDFTAAPGAANAYGLVGFDANLPGPNKRPLSSMTPTIVLKDGKVVLVTGSPGGSRIISTVLQVLLNTLDYRMNIAAAVAAPRLHQQWMPDDVRVEQGFPDQVLAGLTAKGHRITSPLGQTSANSIFVSGDGVFGAPDPRTRGSEAAGN
jgi:gamma-glutamyltranspeptidase/glutathione hydrolase